jgi:hypothetical protein
MDAALVRRTPVFSPVSPTVEVRGNWDDEVIMIRLSLWRRWFARKRFAASTTRLRLEPLEDRTLLTVNPLVAENQLTGTPQSVWDIQYGGSADGDPTLQGFASDISVNHGQTVSFKINDTQNVPYHIDIYRMGYYQGNGARLVAQISSSQTIDKVQPNPVTGPTTGLLDCGNWSVTASWAVPANAASGIYFAHLIRNDTGGDSHIVFVVRDDNDPTPSDLLFQTSDSSWEAYNSYGGNSLYDGQPRTNGLYNGSYAVSYNRPFNTRATNPWSWVFNAEYPMVRWLEANGYNVSYFTDVDSDRNGAQILQHKAFLSVGHDEYWSAGQRANVQAALNAGVNLAFFSGNEVYWKTYYSPSIDGTNTPYRTLVTYKETLNEQLFPNETIWTGTWRDPTFSPPLDGGNPENALTGTMSVVNGYRDDSIAVPASDAALRFWRNTPVAGLTGSQTYTMPAGTLGYEWDVVPDNGFEPPGSINLSSTTVSLAGNQLLQDYGGRYAPGSATHSLHLYRSATSHALVFGAGTVQYSWGLDGNHDLGQYGTQTDPALQQATVNLFADMRVQPGSLQPGLVAATASTDTTPPTSTITSPSNGQTLLAGQAVTISGTATDSGGGVVAGVEVSVDGGKTWHPAALVKAATTANWSFTWTPANPGGYVIQTRAVDDSGNIETPSAGRGVTVILQGYTIFSPASTPKVVSKDLQAIEVGVQFTSDTAGQVTGVRFYDADPYTHTHTVHLWSSTGTLLDTGTSTGETGVGWVQVTFATPLTITAGTVYVASYYAPAGQYAADANFFSSSGTDSPPLHAPSGTNGVYAYGVGGAFPNLTYSGSNYWVDVVLTTPNTASPIIYSVSPSPSAAQVSASARVTVTFNKAMDPTTITASTVFLKDANGNVAAASLSYDPATQTAFLTPSAPLAPAMTYTLTVLGGSSGPVVKDSGGHALAATYTSSFFTSGPAPTVVSVSPTSGANGVSNAAAITVTFSHPMDPSTLTASTFFVKDSGGNVLPASVSYNPATFTAILTTRSFLLTSATYTVTLQGGAGGVKDLNGLTLGTSLAWTFVTAAQGTLLPNLFRSSALPQTASAGAAGSPVEVGVKFTSDFAGLITGVRFYKGSQNTGTHVGDLWSSTGQLLARATFTNETASGWQQVNFSSPVTISAHTTYIASYFSPSGLFAQDQHYFDTAGVDGSPLHAGSSPAVGGNGVYAYSGSPTYPGLSYNGSNYWVDVAFQLVPFITAATPASGAIQVSPSTPVTVTFSEALDPTTVTTSTVVLKDANGNAVPAAVSYNASTFTATLTPNAALAGDAVYTVSVLGGSSGPVIKDQYGNAMLATTSWSFQTDGPAPVVNATTPAAGATGVSTAANVTVTFSHPMDPTTLTASTIFLKDSGGNLVPAVLTYDPTSFTATLTPNGFLATGATYTATVLGGSGTAVKDINGRPLASTLTFSFTASPQPTLSPTIWKPTSQPSAFGTDSNSVEVGVKFYSTAVGYVTGIRFYKGPGQTGTHVGNLWTLGGQLLATATFTNESAGGWQQVNFSTAVAIQANTVYVASYFAPNGHYADDVNFFNTSGADAFPLHAPATGGVAGGNGVYAYGASSSFPGSTYNGSNYWVDVVFTVAPTVVAITPASGAKQVSATAPVTVTFSKAVDPTTITSSDFFLKDPGGNLVAATLSYNASTFTATLTPNAPLSPFTTYTASVLGGPSGIKDASGSPLSGNAVWSFLVDGPAPVVNTVSPASGTTGVGTTVVVTVAFSHAMDPTTLTTASLVVKDAGGNVVPLTVSYNPANFTATLTPYGFFAPATTYTVTVQGGAGGSAVQDVNGRPLASTLTFSFTTTAQASYYPSIWRSPPPPATISTDSNSVELGVKFYASANGFISGIRFYKGTGNNGTHVGNLWTLGGQLLATATFTNETASGWQQVNFATPVAITAGTVYVASYFAPTGHYAVDQGFFNSLGADGTLLHAPSSPGSGGNGVYVYAASSSFPNQTFNGSNYWVDVIFTNQPMVTGSSAPAGATNVSRTAPLTITFDRAMDPTTLTTGTVFLKDAGGNVVAATLSYNPVTFTVTLTPSAPLNPNAAYTVVIRGGSQGVKDAYGNSLTGDDTWSFTTGS